MKDKGNIVVVGDEPSVYAVGKPVTGVSNCRRNRPILWYKRYWYTLTAENIQGTDIPVKVVFDIERSSAATSGATP